jgi:signal transduction histidine kinase
MTRIAAVFRPPVFDDPDTNRSAWLLDRLIWLTAAVYTLIRIAGFVLQPATASRSVRTLVIIWGVSALTFLLLRWRQVLLGSILFAAQFWVVIVIATVNGWGLETPVLPGLVIVVLAAGLLIGWRAGLLASLVCILTLLGIAYADANQLLLVPPSSPAPVNYLLANLQMASLIVTFVYFYTAQNATALAAARRELAQRKQAEEALRALSGQLVAVHEEERGHLARELHDEVGQALTALKLILQVLPRLEPEPAQLKLREAVQLVTELTERTHDISLDLRPAMLDDFGLVSALLWFFERYELRTGIRVNPEFVRFEGRLSPSVETTSYRIVQEALTNVARHAGVSQVTVRLLCNQEVVRIQVEDAGPGFDVAAALTRRHRAGLAGMHERAALLGGWVKVESEPGAGTQVLGLVPLDAPATGP